MALPVNIPAHQKLIVLMRVEGGSLGPQGQSHLQAFCEFAQAEVDSKSSSSGHLWQFLPRTDKKDPEISFKIGTKHISHAQAEKYLNRFGLELEAFTWDAADTVALLIEQYFNRAPN